MQDEHTGMPRQFDKKIRTTEQLAVCPRWRSHCACANLPRKKHSLDENLVTLATSPNFRFDIAQGPPP